MGSTKSSNWTDIEAIYFRFRKHRNEQDYPDAHDLLNITYAKFIPNLNDLFEDGASRTKTKENVIDIIRSQIIGEIKDRATDTADKDLIEKCIEELPMLSHTDNGELVSVKTAQDIEHILNNASNHSKSVTISLDIGSLSFKNVAGNADLVNVKCFEDIRKATFELAVGGEHILPVRNFLLIKRLEDIPGVDGGVQLVSTLVQYVYNTSRLARLKTSQPDDPETKFFAYRFNDFSPTDKELGFRRTEVDEFVLDEGSDESFPLWRSTFSGRVPMELETIQDIFPFKIVKAKLHIELSSAFVDGNRVRPSIVLSKKQETPQGQPQRRDKPLIISVQSPSGPLISEAVKKVNKLESFELVSPYPRVCFFFDKKKNYCPRYSVHFVLKNKGVERQVATLLPLVLVSTINTLSWWTDGFGFEDVIDDYPDPFEARQHLVLSTLLALAAIFMFKTLYEPSLKASLFTKNNMYLFTIFFSLILSAIPRNVIPKNRMFATNFLRTAGMALLWASFLFPIGNYLAFLKLINEYTCSEEDAVSFEKGENFKQWKSSDPFSKYFLKLENGKGPEKIKNQRDLEDNGYEVDVASKDYRICYGAKD